MNPQQRFWEWFREHSSELMNFEKDQERIFDQLAMELQKVDSNLTFEFGPKGAKREFIISAGGIKKAFPSVSALAHAAPAFDQWQITAFRPRRISTSAVDFKGKRVDPKDVQFSLLDNGKIAGIYLFIPGFQESDIDLKQIGYLLLDETLGEYDVETRLGLIKMFSTGENINTQRYPLSDLAAQFDKLVIRLEGHTGKPS
jgi:hypothetical protein